MEFGTTPGFWIVRKRKRKQRECGRPSPAMFLETVTDFNLPLVANVFRSLQRIDRIRSVEPKNFYPAWRRIRRVTVKHGLPSPETDARGENLT